MDSRQELERLAEKTANAAIRGQLLAAAHKLRFPMTEILAKIPGDTLKERAEAIGVSRQTMYVWAHERFRPGKEQAAIISKLTGVPVWQIRDLETGVNDGDIGATGEGDGGKLAATGEKLPARQPRQPAKRARMVRKRYVGRGAGAVRG